MGCGTCTLVLFNLFLLVPSFVLLGTGIWLLADKTSLIGVLRVIESDYIEAFSGFTEELAYVLVIVGGVAFLLSFLGYFGALRKSTCMLSLYGILLTLLLVAEVCGIAYIYCYKDKAYGSAKSEIRNWMLNSASLYGKPASAHDPNNAYWNDVMSRFNCCGVDNYHDFEKSPHWLENKGEAIIPRACCKLQNIKNLQPVDEICLTQPDANNSHFETGCYDILITWIEQYKFVWLSVAIGVCTLQCLCIIIAFALCKSFRKRNQLRFYHNESKA